jgi:hypothetical protein
MSWFAMRALLIKTVQAEKDRQAEKKLDKI